MTPTLTFINACYALRNTENYKIMVTELFGLQDALAHRCAKQPDQTKVYRDQGAYEIIGDLIRYMSNPEAFREIKEDEPKLKE